MRRIGPTRWFTSRWWLGTACWIDGGVDPADVTDLVAAKKEERSEADQRFRLAMSHSAIGMTIVAPDGGLLEVNPALCAMYWTTQSPTCW